MSLSRRDRILVLAWSLPEAFRDLEAHSTETRRLSPALWQLCQPCDGDGNTRDRWGKPSLCPVCQGAGRYRTDPYAEDGQPVSGVGDSLPSRILVRDQTCDRCDGDGVIPGRYVNSVEPGLARCPKCDGTGHQQIPIDTDAARAGSAALDVISWKIPGGDWDALDAALERMRSNGRRPLWRDFVAAYVEPPYQDRRGSGLALAHVDRMMPAQIRVPGAVIEAWQQRGPRTREQIRKRAARMGRDHRNREIRAALKLGRTTEEVARIFAISESQVRRIA